MAKAMITNIPPTLELDATRRPTCPACLRPRVVCLCEWIRPVSNRVELVLLQHPLEQQHAKGTARLLHLSLARSRLLVGEVFDPALVAPPDRRTLLLYPGADETAPDLLLDPAIGCAALRLIVLDATWRKSRKMIHLNPWLQDLPRYSLLDPPPSRYLIRRAHQTHQLSTLEASLLAIGQIEGDAERYQPMLQAFDGFVQAQQRQSAPWPNQSPVSAPTKSSA
jgi:DTW domain-containing protein YfiP